MFDALNGRKGPALQRETVIDLIISDAVPKPLSAPAHRWVFKRQSPIVSLQFSANQRRPPVLPLTIDKSHHQPNHPAESTAPDDQPTQVFVDHLLNNVLYHFRCHFIQATINQVGHCLTD